VSVAAAEARKAEDASEETHDTHPAYHLSQKLAGSD